MEIHIQNRKKGFTLAELLVVVAIVAILAAISIPIFTRQLEASRRPRILPMSVLPMQR